MSEDNYPRMYSLTDLTGQRASAGRTTVALGFELPWRTFIVSVVAFCLALPIALILYAFIGIAGYLLIPLSIAAALFFVEGRSRKGMKLRRWQHIRDERLNQKTNFFICGQLLEVGEESAVRKVVSSSVPVASIGVEATSEIDAHDLFAPTTSKKKKRQK